MRPRCASCTSTASAWCFRSPGRISRCPPASSSTRRFKARYEEAHAMSHFTEVKTRIVDQAALLLALGDLGFQPNQIEIHEKAKHLYGYKDDRRAQTAEVIIRRQHISASSND